MYSVWNQPAGLFDYYEDSRTQEALNAPVPKHVGNRTLGLTIDQAAWPLPVDARKVGSGDVAIGRVASRGSAPALGDVLGTSSPMVKAGLLLAAAALAYKYVLKGRLR